MLEETLIKAGLTDSQSKCYLTLLKSGELTPPQLAEMIGETRTNCYAIVDKLITLGLVSKTDSSKMTVRAESPVKIKNILAKKQQEIKNANSEISMLLPELLSMFCLNNATDEIIKVSGKDALEIAYDSMINNHEDVFVLSSGVDHKLRNEFNEIIKSQAIKLAKAKIKTYILIQSENYMPDHDVRQYQIAKPLPKDIKIDARVMIFGDNIIFSKMNNQDINNIMISSREIASSLRSIFINIWNSNQTELPGHPDRNINLSF